MGGNNPQPRHLDYLDFELEIGLGSGREYPVAVLHSPAGEARATMHFPLDDLALENRLLALQNALLRSGGQQRRTLSPQQQAVQDFGRELFEALFATNVRGCYMVSLREAAQQRKGLRLKLRIRPPELAALPWEYLWHPDQAEYLSLSTRTPIVRYLELPQRIQPLAVTPPLRILGMIAGPSDLPKLHPEREKQRMERALGDLSSRGLVELTWLAGESWRDLMGAMRRGTWHIFHFIGHGGFDHNSGEGLIVLADREGKAAHFSATRLGRLLADHDALRLVLLNSCEGARGSGRDIFSSTASILVRRGIPAVLAMQYEITDRAAIEFARTFYEAVVDGMPVDGAVAELRKAISFAVNNTVEWGTPVVYMRSPDGVLFQMTERPSGARAPAPGLAPAPPVDVERERQLEQRYLDGLDAFWVEEWDEAARCFQAVVDQEPEYGDAAARLREAERRGELARLYAQAQTAQEAGDWPGARAALEQLVAEAPDYRDAAARLEIARKQVQLADLYAQAQQLHHAGRWQAVVNVFGQIAALAPEHPDPEGLLAAAQRGMEAEQRRAEVCDLYGRAGRAVDAGQWTEARRLLRQVQEREPGYREAERLLARAEAEIERQEQERRRREWLDRLYEEAQDLARAGQWQQARIKVEEIHRLDPQFADPEGIAAKAQAEVEKEDAEARRQKELDALYAEAVRLLRAGQYQAALDRWEQVQARDPQYPDRDKIQATARRERAAPAERDRPQAAQPKRLPLPGWLWPAAGGAAVLLVIVVVIIAVLGGKDGDVWIRPADGMTMLYVPAGEFLMGSTDADIDASNDEKPQHTVYLDAFWIDKTEVTNAQYRQCVEAGACSASALADDSDFDGDQQPVVGVDWNGARAYCEWAGARLPTEAEWEKTARGTDGRIYPWGDSAPDCSRAQYGGCDGWLVPVGSKPAGASPYGVLDMAGNVWEWTGSLYWPYPYDAKDGREDLAVEGVRVVRGGSWSDSEWDALAALRDGAEPSDWDESLGFRCARSGSGP